MTSATFMSRVFACLLPCVAACSSATEIRGGPGDLPTRLQISAADFVSRQAIPQDYTCDGEGASPALRWSQVPGEAESLVLIVDDPDAPGRVVTHWLVYNLPIDADLAEGASGARLPRGAAEGQNDWQTVGWTGPCPESGRHHYHFRLYALDVALTGLDAPTRQELEAAMQGHVIASGELVGTYQRTGAT
jgi:Raf kinase inhibitor-like YbhB/YbcL family protein